MTQYTREQLCRMTLEPHGLEVLEFWEDAEGYGVCKTRDNVTGKVQTWSQNPAFDPTRNVANDI